MHVCSAVFVQPSRRETLSASRRRQDTSVSSATQGKQPTVGEAESLMSPAGDDWDTLDDAAKPEQTDILSASAPEGEDLHDGSSLEQDTISYPSTDESTSQASEVESVTSASSTALSSHGQQRNVQEQASQPEQPPPSVADSSGTVADATLISRLEYELEEHRRSHQKLEAQVSQLQTDLTTAKVATQKANQLSRQQQEDHLEQLDEEKHRCSELQRKNAGLEDKVQCSTEMSYDVWIHH